MLCQRDLAGPAVAGCTAPIAVSGSRRDLLSLRDGSCVCGNMHDTASALSCSEAQMPNVISSWRSSSASGVSLVTRGSLRMAPPQASSGGAVEVGSRHCYASKPRPWPRLSVTDWPSQFATLGLAQLTRHDKPVSIRIDAAPGPSFALTAATLIYNGDGQLLGTAEGMGQAIYRNRLPDVNKTVAENAPALYKTLGALEDDRVCSSKWCRALSTLLLDRGRRDRNPAADCMTEG